jgi:hypothetical protein
VAVAHDQAPAFGVELVGVLAMYAATSASNAAASIRRAPSRTISSISDPPVVVAAGVGSCGLTTVSTGVPSRPAPASAGLA